MNCEKYFKLILECGKTYNQPNVRIIGGSPAVPYSWPAQVLIRQNFKGFIEISNFQYIITGSLLCAGTLIDEDTIITAANCVRTNITYSGYQINSISTFYPTLESMFMIYVGAYNLSALNISAGYTVKKIVTVNNSYSL